MLLKRAFDILVSVCVLVVFAPAFLCVALAVWFESGAPIFYGQTRVGRRFRPFRIWKFRSMRVGGAGPSVTVRGDPRITRVGRIIRGTRLDELPQFWNVLIGDMSLVGPRPEVPEFVQLYRERYRRILEVRPGMTDPATLQFCSEEELLAKSADPLRAYVDSILPAKLALAEAYLSKRSLMHDLRLLVMTAMVCVNRGQAK